MRFVTSFAVIFCIALAACSGSGNGTRSSSGGTAVNDLDPNIPLRDQVARLPGVYQNDQGELRIRGSTRSPLVVIDGMQTMSSDLSGINPADVESVEVLKGPETSMYGVRGGAGVIVITTKRGGDSDSG